MSDKKEKLKRYIDEFLNEEQIEFMYNLVTNNSIVSKQEILTRFAGVKPDEMNFDTATPQPYMDELKSRYPNLYNGIYIYDYTKHKVWGELVNINDLVVRHMLKIFPG